MREIKFRGWCNERKKIVLSSDDNWIGNYDDLYFCDLQNILNDPNINLMQYTGLKDKNGNEIYEGDIVEAIDEELFNIEFSDGKYWCVGYKQGEPIIDIFEPYFLDRESIESQQIVIIGNIYNNPELLAS